MRRDLDNSFVSLRKRRLSTDFLAVFNYLNGRRKERTGQGRARKTSFSQRCAVIGKTGVGTLKIVIRYREMFFHHKRGQKL